jgi:diguanylate cyclase (GGDEF)-like protein/PAS domain S-box-containing protein
MLKLKFIDKTILYVEDDLNSQAQMLTFLESFIKNILVANNGQEGLKLFHQNHCDMIITDVKMPLMSGLDMISEIRKVDKDIPICILTNFNESRYLLEALKKDVTSYLFKPINFKDVKKTIYENILTDENSLLLQSLDKEGKILHINDEWLNFLKYTKEEIIGRFFIDFIDKKFLKSFKSHFSNPKDNKLENLNIQLIDKEGNRKEVIINGSPILDKNANFISASYELKSIKYFLKSFENISKSLKQEKYINEIIKIQAGISKEISKRPNKEEFYKNICDTFSSNIKKLYSFIVKKNDNTWKIKASFTTDKLDTKHIIEETLKINDSDTCVIPQVLKSKSITFINNIYEINTKNNPFLNANINSILAIPLSKDLENIDTILFLMHSNNHKYTKEEIDLLYNITDTILLGLENIEYQIEKEQLLEQLHKKATTDFLTNSLNRHAGINILSKEISRKNRYKQSLSIIFFDIDYFKNINDNYGHEVGDRVLSTLSEKIKSTIRVSDSLIRWGGEEFVIILPEADQEAAIKLTKKVQEQFTSINILNLDITASFGITQLRESDNLDTLIERADFLMYEAKLNGRNNYKVD